MTKFSTLSLIAAAVIALMAIAACGQPAPTEPSQTTMLRVSPPIPPPAPTVAPEAGDAGGPALVGTPVTVHLADNGGAGPFLYEPVNFEFATGEIVNFTFIGEAAFHTFTVSELDINIEVEASQTVGFDFVFDTPGTYALICTPHEALGMVGQIVVR